MIDQLRKRLLSISRLTYAVAALFQAGFIFLMSSLKSPGIPGSSYLSNLCHAPVFGVLAVLVALALGPRQFRFQLLALLLTILYGVSDEIHQSFTPGRSPDPLDVSVDALGALFALFLLRLVIERRPQGLQLLGCLSGLLAAIFIATYFAAYGS